MLLFQVVALQSSNDLGRASTNSLWSMVVIGFIVLLFIVAAFALRKREYDDGLDRAKIKATWNEIQKTSEMGIMGLKLAVIEADKLVDNVMRQLLIPGETMGERLKMAEFKYPDIRRVWPAHKTRNMLVHDSTYQLTTRAGKDALRDFEKALKLLKAL